MPTKEEQLYERTFKGQTDSTDQRVYYTIRAPMWKDPPQPTPSEWTPEDRSMAHRTASILGGLIQHLETKGLLAEADLDEILLSATM